MPATAIRREGQRRRRGENRALIVAAAEDALRRKPFREVSVDELMQAAGLSRTIFYRHFDDLSDLLLKVAGAAFDEVYERMAALTAVDAADLDALRRALAPGIAETAAQAPLVRAIAEAASHDAAVEEVYEGVIDRFVELTADALLHLRPDLADPRQTARALTLMNIAYLLDAFGGSKRKVSAEAATDTIAGIWAGTLVPR